MAYVLCSTRLEAVSRVRILIFFSVVLQSVRTGTDFFLFRFHVSCLLTRSTNLESFPGRRKGGAQATMKQHHHHHHTHVRTVQYCTFASQPSDPNTSLHLMKMKLLRTATSFALLALNSSHGFAVSSNFAWNRNLLVKVTLATSEARTQLFNSKWDDLEDEDDEVSCGTMGGILDDHYHTTLVLTSHISPSQY